MRVIDKNAPTDVDKFWFALGEMRVKAMVTGQTGEIVVEEFARVAEALKDPVAAAKAGQKAFLSGVFRQLNALIIGEAEALKTKRGHAGFVKTALMEKLNATPQCKITVVPREARMVTRKTVESYDENGRISSLIEERVEV